MISQAHAKNSKKAQKALEKQMEKDGAKQSDGYVTKDDGKTWSYDKSQDFRAGTTGPH